MKEIIEARRPVKYRKGMRRKKEGEMRVMDEWMDKQRKGIKRTSIRLEDTNVKEIREARRPGKVRKEIQYRKGAGNKCE